MANSCKPISRVWQMQEHIFFPYHTFNKAGQLYTCKTSSHSAILFTTGCKKSIYSDRSRVRAQRGGGLGSPLFWVRKRELQKEEKPQKNQTAPPLLKVWICHRFSMVRSHVTDFHQNPKINVQLKSQSSQLGQ